MDKEGTILIVDDSPVDLLMLTEVLTSAGFAVRQADSGELALASIAAKKPDLVLLDILMTVMDGFEVCRQLKAREEFRDIPVIFLSSADDVKDKIEGFKLGAVDYVNKPFQSKELLARVGVHLEIGRLTRQLKVKTMQLEEANNNLLCKEEHFRLLVDNSLDAVMLTIPDGTILSANKAAEKMFGLSENEICRIGRNGIIDVTDSRLPALAEERMRTGRIHGELTGIRSDGTRFPIEFTSALFSDHEGNVRSSIII